MIFGPQTTPLWAGPQEGSEQIPWIFYKFDGKFREFRGILPGGLRSWEFFDVIELKKLGNPYLVVFGSILGAQSPILMFFLSILVWRDMQIAWIFCEFAGKFMESRGFQPRGLRSWEFFDVVELKKLGNPYLGVFGSIFEVQRSILGVFFGYFGPGGDRSGLDPF